jgi:type 2A phosphatase activator TIP41
MDNIKVEPLPKPEYEHFQHKDWHFYWNVQQMLSSKELDQLSDHMKINRLPDMLFGYNRFYFTNPAKDFIYEINPLQMLDLASFTERHSYLIPDLSESNGRLNFIYYNPKEVKVKYYEKWKDLKVDRDDIQKVDPTMDWSFSSCYMGYVDKLSSHGIFEQTKLDVDPFTKTSITIEKTTEELPVHRLGKDNPIIKYMEVNLYDDELCDNGLAQGNLRYVNY